MRPRIVLCSVAMGAVVAATAPLFAMQDHQKPAASAPSSDSRRVTSHSHDVQDEGERVFRQNCARCHNAPTGFSSRITGTIVRHMRVRANLSRHDEQVLMQFFNP